MARFLQIVYIYLVTTVTSINTYIHSFFDKILFSRISLYDGNKINNYLTIFFIGIIIGWVFSYYHTIRSCGYVV